MPFCTDPKLQGVKVVIFCWPLAKVTATVSLARAQPDGSFCLPIRQRFQPSSASVLVKKQRTSPQPNVLPQWLQVDQVTTRAQVRFTPGMIASAHIIPAVPNFCGQRKQSPGTGFGLQQGWLNCKHLRI